MHRACVGLLLGALGATSALAVEPFEEPPVVVELFTSQGCSSCPPADAFLTDLAHQADNVLPLAFHVTYWDRLGWRDPYSLDAATSRQRQYAHALGQDGVYTPEMVVDGVTGFVGSNRAEGLAAIARAARDHRGSVPLGVTRDGSSLVVAAGTGSGQARLLLVGFDRAHETRIGRGENRDRTLLESNIVRSFAAIGIWTGDAVTLRVPPPEGENVAVLLQSENGRILGAARLQKPAS